MTGTKLLAYNGAPESMFNDGKRRLHELFPGEAFDFSAADPGLFVFLSGGSEREALQHIQPGKFLLLAAFEENNSYAAATEVKAHFDAIGQECLLTDLKNETDRRCIVDYIQAGTAHDKLQGKRLGLIGRVSEWLVASDVAGAALASKFGIDLVKIPWEEVRSYKECTPGPEFLSAYTTDGAFDIGDAGRVHVALSELVTERRLDAITVECFSLVKANSVTACLALSKLNDDGIPAGCEGDLASIAGIMLVQEVTGIIPWMANTIKVEADRVKFAHCTAPATLMSKFKIDTHYETGLGTSITGEFAGDDVTIFRIDRTLGRAFLECGTIVGRPASSDACRTQIEVTLPEATAGVLKHAPLGNHHLIIPGDRRDALAMFCRRQHITLINSQPGRVLN